MNQSRTEPGQSMEEILASIRRIIAEGDHETRGAPGAVGATSPAPEAEAADKDSPEERPLAAVTAEAEILGLAGMRQGGGGATPSDPDTPRPGRADTADHPAASSSSPTEAAKAAPAFETSTLAQ